MLCGLILDIFSLVLQKCVLYYYYTWTWSLQARIYIPTTSPTPNVNYTGVHYWWKCWLASFIKLRQLLQRYLIGLVWSQHVTLYGILLQNLWASVVVIWRQLCLFLIHYGAMKTNSNVCTQPKSDQPICLYGHTSFKHNSSCFDCVAVFIIWPQFQLC